MGKTNKAKRIIEKWKVDFVKMDKKRNSISDNFDQLFYSLYIASTPYDIAREIVDDAVAISLPSQSTAKWVWNAKKKFIKLSFKEWLDEWKEDIRNKALTSYYELYPIEDEPNPPPLPQKREAVSKVNTLKGMKTDDELNEDDFYKSSKKVTRENPFLFSNKEDTVE